LSNLIYAIIDDDAICTSITSYEQAIEVNSLMIKLENIDQSLLGKKWNGSAWEEVAITTEEAREWRDLELLRTDSLMGLSDYPNTDNLTTYRQELRDWPSTGGFPGTKPTLGS
tara:strand:+ start:81 stop:419 length:339 start_codon:yes stop_codon:yes gene_type:complete